jgi:hypothetical protein
LAFLAFAVRGGHLASLVSRDEGDEVHRPAQRAVDSRLAGLRNGVQDGTIVRITDHVLTTARPGSQRIHAMPVRSGSAARSIPTVSIEPR